MNGRPFFRTSIVELEALAATHQDNPKVLFILLDELGHRATARASLLRDKVNARLAVLGQESITFLDQPKNGNLRTAVAQTDSSGGAGNTKQPSAHTMTSDEPSNPETSRTPAAEPLERRPAQHGESSETEKLLTAFRYLKKLAEYSRKVVYAIEDYRQLGIFEHDLAGLPGVRFNATVDGEPVWISIGRLRKESAPEPDSTAAVWLSFDRRELAEPDVLTSRMATVSDDEAQVLVDEGLVREENVRVNLDDARQRDVTFLFDDSEEAKTAVQHYVHAIWQPWAEQEGKRRCTISHYEKLFTLHKSIESEGAEFPLELVCAIGLARQKLGPHRVNTPVIEQLVEIEMAADSSLFVRPRQRAPFVGLSPFGGSSVASIEHVVDVASKHFASMVALGERDLSPFDHESFSPILSAAATYLDKSGRYLANERPPGQPRDPALPPIEETLTVTDTWALFVRNRSDDFYIQDLDRLMRKIAEPENSDSTTAVGRRLVTIATSSGPPEDELDFRKSLGGFGPGTGEVLGNPRVPDHDTSRLAPSGDGAAPKEAGTDGFFLPLPFNEEQIEILRRLERDGEVGTVVQGPPGTGKSHTISNIICHYLATGRRVLVMSKGEPALAVLRDKVPEAVRQLTISLLTNEREGLKQLERAIGILSEEISQTDIPAVERDLRSTMTELAGLKGRLSQIETRLLQLGMQQLKEPPWYLIEHLEERNLASLAKWCADHRSQFGWLDDRPSVPPPDWNLSDAEMDDLRGARQVLGEDISYVGAALPRGSEMPDVAQATAVHADLVAASRIADRAASGEIALLSERADRAFDRAVALRQSIAAIVEIRSATSGWTTSLLDRTIKTERSGADGSPLDQLLGSLRSLAQERKSFLGRPVEGVGLESLSTEVLDALSRAARGDRPFGVMPFGYKQARLVVGQIRIAGAVPASEADWAHASAWAAWLASLKRFVHSWNAIADEEGTEQVELEPGATGRWLTRTASLVERVDDAATRNARLIRDELNVLFPRGLNVDRILHDIEAAQSALQHIDDNLSRVRLLRASEDRATWLERARTVPGEIGRRMLAFLRDSIGNPDLQQREIAIAWEDMLNEIRRLSTLQRSMNTVHEVGTKVQRVGLPIGQPA